MDLEKKLKKLQHSKLPNLVSQIKLLSDEINAFKSAIQTYKEITKKEKIADDAWWERRQLHGRVFELKKLKWIWIFA